MSQLTTLDVAQWQPPLDPATSAYATRELETGNVLFLPMLKFTPADEERRLLSPAWSDGKAKNISYDPSAAAIRHANTRPIPSVA